MNSIADLIWHQGKFLGIEWHLWKVLGWVGNTVFFSRFLVQWYYTERLKRVVVPVGFWWLSLAGALLLFSYATFYQRDSVFIFAYAFTWIPYIRNLMIHHRHRQSEQLCPGCRQRSAPTARFCFECGTAFSPAAAVPKESNSL